MSHRQSIAASTAVAVKEEDQEEQIDNDLSQTPLASRSPIGQDERPIREKGSIYELIPTRKEGVLKVMYCSSLYSLYKFHSVGESVLSESTKASVVSDLVSLGTLENFDVKINQFYSLNNSPQGLLFITNNITGEINIDWSADVYKHINSFTNSRDKRISEEDTSLIDHAVETYGAGNFSIHLLSGVFKCEQKVRIKNECLYAFKPEYNLPFIPESVPENWIVRTPEEAAERYHKEKPFAEKKLTNTLKFQVCYRESILNPVKLCLHVRELNTLELLQNLEEPVPNDGINRNDQVIEDAHIAARCLKISYERLSTLIAQHLDGSWFLIRENDQLCNADVLDSSSYQACDTLEITQFRKKETDEIISITVENKSRPMNKLFTSINVLEQRLELEPGTIRKAFIRSDYEPFEMFINLSGHPFFYNGFNGDGKGNYKYPSSQDDFTSKVKRRRLAGNEEIARNIQEVVDTDTEDLFVYARSNSTLDLNNANKSTTENGTCIVKSETQSRDELSISRVTKKSQKRPLKDITSSEKIEGKSAFHRQDISPSGESSSSSLVKQESEEPAIPTGSKLHSGSTPESLFSATSQSVRATTATNSLEEASEASPTKQNGRVVPGAEIGPIVPEMDINLPSNTSDTTLESQRNRTRKLKELQKHLGEWLKRGPPPRNLRDSSSS